MTPLPTIWVNILKYLILQPLNVKLNFINVIFAVFSSRAEKKCCKNIKWKVTSKTHWKYLSYSVKGTKRIPRFANKWYISSNSPCYNISGECNRKINILKQNRCGATKVLNLLCTHTWFFFITFSLSRSCEK